MDFFAKLALVLLLFAVMFLFSAMCAWPFYHSQHQIYPWGKRFVKLAYVAVTAATLVFLFGVT